jgi:PBP1b-binding outer membrane lipoprotein LpoB
MKRILLIIAIVSVFTSCSGKRSESATDADTTATSTTPPARQDTNPIGIMMGDTTIGINDSLKNGSPKK